jgi:hypothetical protein
MTAEIDIDRAWDTTARTIGMAETIDFLVNLFSRNGAIADQSNGIALAFLPQKRIPWYFTPPHMT